VAVVSHKRTKSAGRMLRRIRRKSYRFYPTLCRIRLIEDRGNRDAWHKIQRKSWHNHLLEQYLLAACIEYHRDRTDSPYRDIAISYVFFSINEAFDPETAVRAGYTHLIADTKCNPQLADRLEARVAADYPEHYQRCLDYLKERA